MHRDPRLLPPLGTVVLRAGTAGPQSALDPAGPAASSIHLLGIVIYVGATLAMLLVTVLMLVPVLRRRERRVNHNLFLWGGGVVLPGVTLTALVPYVLSVGGVSYASALSFGAGVAALIAALVSPLDALGDQQLAGLLMWVPLGLPYLAAGLWLASRSILGHLDEAAARGASALSSSAP
jgi:hypothetical protein